MCSVAPGKYSYAYGIPRSADSCQSGKMISMLRLILGLGAVICSVQSFTIDNYNDSKISKEPNNYASIPSSNVTVKGILSKTLLRTELNDTSREGVVNENRTAFDELIAESAVIDDNINDTSYDYNYYYYDEKQNSDSNDTGKKPTGRGSCKMCQIREEKRLNRIEAIKNRLSHALKLDVLGTPNITRSKLPKVPSFLKLQEKFENGNQMMMSDSPEEYNSLMDEREEYGEPERTYVSASEVPGDKISSFQNTVYFNSQLPSEKKPEKAFLWFYIPRSRVEDKNLTEIKIYYIEPPGKSGGPFKRQLIFSKKKYFAKASGWHHFKVLNEFLKWSARDDLNYGLVIEALDDSGRNMVSMPGYEGYLEGYEPMLDIRTSLRRTNRKKRSTNLFCDDIEIDACCRYPLQVDFVEFGWDFVIAPKKYDAYYCAGECAGEAMESAIGTYIVANHPMPSSAPPSSITNSVGPCCTPTHMSDLTMLYFDHTNNVLLTKLPRMKADRCGCA